MTRPTTRFLIEFALAVIGACGLVAVWSCARPNVQKEATDTITLHMAAPVREAQPKPPAVVPNRGQRIRVFPVQ